MARKREGQVEPESDQVGYGRPPVAHQFKPGQTNNPWGRKGKPKPPTDFLDRSITISIDGRPQQVTRDEAIDHALFQQACAGKVSAAKELEQRRRRRIEAINANGEPDELSAEERAALDRMVERKAEERRGTNKRARKRGSGGELPC